MVSDQQVNGKTGFSRQIVKIDLFLQAELTPPNLK